MLLTAPARVMVFGPLAAVIVSTLLMEAVLVPAASVRVSVPPARSMLALFAADPRVSVSALALPIVESKAATASGRGLLARDDIRESLLPKLVDRARLFADAQVPARVEAARRAMHEALGAEISRLRDLQKVNRTVRPEEVELLVEQQAALDRYLGASRLRLDAVRLVHRGPQR